jgi:hypothetical protein
VKLLSFGGDAGGTGTRMVPGKTTQFTDSENYLPPNSIATAKVVVGVDATTNTKSQTDPLPVVLRITGRRARSMWGKLLKTNIVGCMVNGAALADLSSEKVYVKLQRMTCPPGGKVAVSEVKGFIAFGGKTGVRGRVVNRSGNLVGQAFIAGVLGGFGRGFSTNSSAYLTSPTVSVNGQRSTLSPSDIAQGGLGQGRPVRRHGLQISDRARRAVPACRNADRPRCRGGVPRRRLHPQLKEQLRVCVSHLRLLRLALVCPMPAAAHATLAAMLPPGCRPAALARTAAASLRPKVAGQAGHLLHRSLGPLSSGGPIMETHQDLTPGSAARHHIPMGRGAASRSAGPRAVASPRRACLSRAEGEPCQPSGQWRHRMGRRGQCPKVTVFSDFHCGYCRGAAPDPQGYGRARHQRPISILGTRRSESVICAEDKGGPWHRGSSRCAPAPIDEARPRHGFNGTVRGWAAMAPVSWCPKRPPAPTLSKRAGCWALWPALKASKVAAAPQPAASPPRGHAAGRSFAAPSGAIARRRPDRAIEDAPSRIDAEAAAKGPSGRCPRQRPGHPARRPCRRSWRRSSKSWTATPFCPSPRRIPASRSAGARPWVPATCAAALAKWLADMADGTGPLRANAEGGGRARPAPAIHQDRRRSYRQRRQGPPGQRPRPGTARLTRSPGSSNSSPAQRARPPSR